MNDAAKAYESTVPDAVDGEAPALPRTVDELGNKIRDVRFDGMDGDVLIDRKLSIFTSAKGKNQFLRQSQALGQSGRIGRIEVPTQTEARRAQKIIDELGINNISVKVVPN